MLFMGTLCFPMGPYVLAISCVLDRHLNIARFFFYFKGNIVLLAKCIVFIPWNGKNLETRMGE